MAKGQDPKMQLSSSCSFYARKGTIDNSYFLALSQEERTGCTPFRCDPLIQYLLVLQEQLMALPIHSSINTSAENYTPVMLCACLAEELLAFRNFVSFPVTTQNQWENPYPHHLSPSTPWLLLAEDADKMLMSHHPDLHLYLWSCHHGCRGCDVQPPLPKVHKGIVAPVFCLDEAVIDLLSEQTTKQTI